MGSLKVCPYSAMRCMVGLFLLPILMAAIENVGGFSPPFVAAAVRTTTGSSNVSAGDQALLRPMGFLPSNPFIAETDEDLRIIKQSMTTPLRGKSWLDRKIHIDDHSKHLLLLHCRGWTFPQVSRPSRMRSLLWLLLTKAK